MGLSLHGNYKYYFSLSQWTNATQPHPLYTATSATHETETIYSRVLKILQVNYESFAAI